MDILEGPAPLLTERRRNVFARARASFVFRNDGAMASTGGSNNAAIMLLTVHKLSYKQRKLEVFLSLREMGTASCPATGAVLRLLRQEEQACGILLHFFDYLVLC